MYQQPADRTFWPHVESEQAAPLAQVRRPDLEREVRQQASTALARAPLIIRYRTKEYERYDLARPAPPREIQSLSSFGVVLGVLREAVPAAADDRLEPELLLSGMYTTS